MIELRRDRLVFSFPEVHPEASLSVMFQRTLRIPDDERSYPLPPGLGPFDLRHVDDHAQRIPSRWLQRGGVMLPMYQSEAMWLSFDSITIDEHWEPYPFAIKIAAGKRCAVSGEAWSEDLGREPQNYVVAPEQPWIDGFVVDQGTIRQFVAMPLGSGYTAEEQLTGQAEHGGLQIQVFPMKREAFERHFPKRSDSLPNEEPAFMADYCMAGDRHADMGLAPGGRMRQEIYEDSFNPSDWERTANSRCFVHLCNSMVWQSVTGSPPPHPAPTAKSYTDAGLPWFDYYDDGATAVKGSSVLRKLKSIAAIGAEKGDNCLPENESVTPQNLITYRKGLKRDQVREGKF